MTSAALSLTGSAAGLGASLPDVRVFTYVVDADDRIVAVSATWAAFAAENGAAPLAASVVGSTVWEHIADPTTEHLYRHLFRQARRSGVPVRVPFRCDAPRVVRDMELELTPASDGALVLRSRLVGERARAPVALLDPLAPRSDALVRMCSWCKRVALGDGWVEVEAAVAANRLFTRVPLLEVTHTMCDACEVAVTGLLDDGAPEG